MDDNGTIDLDGKRLEKSLMGMIFQKEEQYAFSDDLQAVFTKHGITDFYLIGFKNNRLSSDGLFQTTGFNITSLSDKISAFHVAKKFLDFLISVPVDNQKELIGHDQGMP
jgi:hypothetical protein